MLFVLIYAAIGILWGCFAVYKQSQYTLKSSFGRFAFVYLLNVIIWPVTVIIAAKKRYLTFKKNH